MEEKLLWLFSHQNSVHSPVNAVSASTALCPTELPIAEPFAAADQFFVALTKLADFSWVLEGRKGIQSDSGKWVTHNATCKLLGIQREYPASL